MAAFASSLGVELFTAGTLAVGTQPGDLADLRHAGSLLTSRRSGLRSPRWARRSAACTRGDPPSTTACLLSALWKACLDVGVVSSVEGRVTVIAAGRGAVSASRVEGRDPAGQGRDSETCSSARRVAATSAHDPRAGLGPSGVSGATVRRTGRRRDPVRGGVRHRRVRRGRAGPVAGRGNRAAGHRRVRTDGGRRRVPAGSPDNVPIVRWLESGVIAATGHHRNGLLLAPHTARLVVELLQGGSS